MALTQPSVKDISDNLIAQLESQLSQTIPLLPKSFMRVLAKAVAAVFVTLYKYGGFIFLQLFVSTASSRETEVNGRLFTPLIEWGRLVGAGDPVAATQAELVTRVTVTNQTGSLSGAQLVSSVNGVTYLQIGSVPLDAAEKDITVRAVQDQSGGDGSGVIGNLDPGQIVSFANPLANVARDTIVQSQTVTGADGESTDAYRQRVLDRFQKRPQGGAYADYVIWGLDVAGIIGIFPYTSDCPGQVDVYVEATPASSGNADGIPTGAQLQAVKDAIELDQAGLATRRPATALVNTLAITRRAFDVEVVSLVVDDPAAVQADIQTSVADYFARRAPFITGVSVPPRTDSITSSAITSIVDDIVSAVSGSFAGVILKLDAAPILSYTLDIGEKAKNNPVQFV